MKKSMLLLIILSITICTNIQSQLPDLLLEVHIDNHETCLSNGAVTFELTDNDPLATVVFNIYKIPDLENPIGVTENLNFGGMNHGEYSVVATESLNGESNSQTKNITILDQREDLTFGVETQDEICGSDGEIRINILSGMAENFEIISGPVIHPPQEENVFTDLLTGSYSMRIIDICGNAHIHDIFVAASNIGLSMRYAGPTNLATCDTINIRYAFDALADHIIHYPVQINIIVHPPENLNLPDYVSSKSYEFQNPHQGAQVLAHWDHRIPFYGRDVEYFYDIEVIDGCGQTHTFYDNVVLSSMIFWTQPELSHCKMNFRFWGDGVTYPLYMDFLESPAGFDPTEFNSTYPGPFYSTAIQFKNLNKTAPEGHYKIRFYDDCGEYIVEREYLTPSLECWFNPVATDNEVGYGSTRMNWKSEIQNVEIISAPATFEEILPFDISDHIGLEQEIRINSLPGGEYVFRGMDSCGNIKDCISDVPAYEDYGFEYEISPNCGSFDLFLHHNNNYINQYTTIGNAAEHYWLQIFDDETDSWINLNGTPHIIGVPPYAYSGYELDNGIVNSNIVGSGHFRILRTIRRITNGYNPTRGVEWEETMVEFDYEMDGLAFNDVYSFVCDDGTYSVACSATGVEPIIYRISTKDGEEFIIENGYEAVFSGLSEGLYNFQIEDPCGNVLNRAIEVTGIKLPNIYANLCEDNNGQLSVIDLPFLEYEWRKSDDEETILSTSAKLDFSPFNSVVHHGEYQVNIRYDSPSSCIDQTFSYIVPLNDSAPNAGNDSIHILCNDITNINFFSLLDTDADDNGLWFDGLGIQLFGVEDYYIGELENGTYQYRYFIDGICEGSDEAIIALEIISCNEPPIAFCKSVNVSADENCLANLEASDFDDGSYDPQGDVLDFSIIPSGPYNIGETEVTLTVSDGVYAVECIATLTVVDTASPELIVDCPEDIDLCGAQSVSWTEPEAADNCGVIEVSKSHAPGDYFEPGIHNISYIYSDLEGNQISCSFIVTIHALPDVSITQSILPELCQGLLVLNSALNNENDLVEEVNYNWSGDLGNDADAIVYENGIYELTVTDGAGCETSSNIHVDEEASDFLSSYVMLAKKHIQTKRSIISGGGIGVLEANKQARIMKSTILNTFVRAPIIKILSGSTVDRFLEEHVNLTLPDFVFNTSNCENEFIVPSGQTRVLSSNESGRVVVKSDGVLIVDSPEWYVRELDLKNNAELIFEQPTVVMVKKNMQLAKNAIVNVEREGVRFFIEEKLEIKEGSDFSGHVYAKNKIHAKKASNNNQTYLQGTFISDDKIQSDEFVNWDWTTLCNENPATDEPEGCEEGHDLSHYPSRYHAKSDNLPDSSESIGENVVISPNPSLGSFNIDLTDYIGHNITINLNDHFGKTIKNLEYTDLESGHVNLDLYDHDGIVYFVEIMINGVRRITKKVVVIR